MLGQVQGPVPVLQQLKDPTVPGPEVQCQAWYQVLTPIPKEVVGELYAPTKWSKISLTETLGPDGRPRDSRKAIAPVFATVLVRPLVRTLGPYQLSGISGQSSLSSCGR